MSNPYRSLSFAELIAAVRSAAEAARRDFGGLGVGRLNWKPAPESWSVAQCLDHLLATNAGYLPLFETTRAGRRKTSLVERLPLLPTIWATLLVGAVSPQASMKVKAPKIFEPAQSEIGTGIVDRFAAQQETLAENFEATERQSLGRIVITSPAAPFVTFSLLDAARILVAHEQRHLQQAARVIQSPDFPAR